MSKRNKRRNRGKQQRKRSRIINEVNETLQDLRQAITLDSIREFVLSDPEVKVEFATLTENDLLWEEVDRYMSERESFNGYWGSVIVIDDPIKPESNIDKEKVITWFESLDS